MEPDLFLLRSLVRGNALRSQTSERKPSHNIINIAKIRINIDIMIFLFIPG